MKVVPCFEDATTGADKDNDLDRLVSRQRIETCPHDPDQFGQKRVASLRPGENEFGISRFACTRSRTIPAEVSLT